MDGSAPFGRKPKYQSSLSLTEHPVLGLEHGCCHWPLGYPWRPDFHLCGDKAVPQRPYCEHHLRIGRQ